jgi:hypothetical protein
MAKKATVKPKKNQQSKASSTKLETPKNTIKGASKKNNLTIEKSVVKEDSKSVIKNKSTPAFIAKEEPIIFRDNVTIFLTNFLDKEFGEIGTTERAEADAKISEFENNILSEIKDVLLKEKSDKLLKQEADELAKTEALNKKVVTESINDGTRIIPVGFELPNEKVAKEINTTKEFVLAKDSTFLMGDLKITHNDTKIVRVDAINYSLSGLVDGLAPFVFPFTCIDLPDAENFWGELIDYEINPTKYIKSEPIMENAPEINPTVPEAITPPLVITEEQKTETIKKFEGLPLTEVNIRELMEVAPLSEASDKKSLGKASDISLVVNNSIMNHMEAYGETINGLINAKTWAKMPISELMDVLNNQCSRDYKYNVIEDKVGYILEITNGTFKTRVPKMPNTYLNVTK